MRSLFIGLVVALVAAPAFGQGTISLTTAGSVLNGGQNEIDIGSVGATMQIDVVIDVADNAPVQFSLKLDGPTTIALSGVETLYGAAATNYASVYGSRGIADLGWDFGSTPSVWWAAENLPQGGGQFGAIGSIAVDVNSGAQEGWVAWAEVTGPFAQGMVFGAIDPELQTTGGRIDPENITVIPLVITPEPASALLLLAGLPLLRRRR